MTDEKRILTTHVGSLARPKKLLDYIAALDNSVAIDSSAFDACLRESVADVVKRQAQAGVDIVSDGEFGKFRTWSAYIASRLSGFEERDIGAATGAGKDRDKFPEFYTQYFPTQHLPNRGVLTCTGPLTYTGRAATQTTAALAASVSTI
jgi:5-methyltetrahydropteroyltriglutamate--homocysteine methyltransferase